MVNTLNISNKDLVAAALTTAICVKFPFLPAPLVAVTVKKFVEAGSSISLEDIRTLLGVLGAPVESARSVWDRVQGEVAEADADEGEDAVEDEALECECPESGEAVRLTRGDGLYRCTDCKQDILVSNGYAWHAFSLECPVTDEAFWAGPEDGDDYECPHCACRVVVKGNSARHTKPLTARCPHSGDRNPVGNTDGQYTCTDCREIIGVQDGTATHG